MASNKRIKVYVSYEESDVDALCVSYFAKWCRTARAPTNNDAGRKKCIIVTIIIILCVHALRQKSKVDLDVKGKMKIIIITNATDKYKICACKSLTKVRPFSLLHIVPFFYFPLLVVGKVNPLIFNKTDETTRARQKIHSLSPTLMIPMTKSTDNGTATSQQKKKLHCCTCALQPKKYTCDNGN